MLDETEASRGKLAVSREEFFADYDTPNKISIAVAYECFDILVDLKPLTIINESGRGFIISDNPVTLYNLLYARRNYRINYGLGTGGIIIFLPLSPTVCFCLCDPEVYDEKSEDGFNITIKSKNQVNELNKMFAQNAYEAIYWGSGVDADYAKRMGREFRTPKPPVEELPIKGSLHSIIRFGTESIFEYYQIPEADFRKVLPGSRLYSHPPYDEDDGYSGTNFNRPGFQRMLADIKAGKIKRVVVKDMSRFGRNYLQVGMYTEMLFPEYGVHFIAVNDGVDSVRGDSEFTAIRNVFNDNLA